MRFHHQQEEIIPFNKELIYNITSDVEKYPEFIPWLSEVEVLNVNNNIIDYNLVVDFKLKSESFSTRDIFTKNEKIEISLIEGPFKYLHNVWYFEEISENKTKVIFEIDFEFKSKLLSMLFSKLFIEAQKKILKVFIKRAEELSKFNQNKLK